MRRFIAPMLASLAIAPTLMASPTPDDRRSLMQTIAEWQYPGSAISGAQASDGATIDATGKRTVPSVICKASMTTDAPVEKVLDYYRTKLSPAPKEDGGKSEPPDAAGRSVLFSDDSESRPFALHTVIVNEGDASTTLVISRGKDEAKTHVAWKQYRRLGK